MTQKNDVHPTQGWLPGANCFGYVRSLNDGQLLRRVERFKDHPARRKYRRLSAGERSIKAFIAALHAEHEFRFDPCQHAD